jgi:hypothetical protein
VAKWMGSIAMDKVGDIALGYSKSNTTTKPSTEFVGRVPTDAKGTMESAKSIKTGTGVQTGAGGRWGDYSSMAIDPTDDVLVRPGILLRERSQLAHPAGIVQVHRL